MKKEELRIGLALSGGGMRAAVYHLGVMKSLAQHNLLVNVKHISTVSGASICMGLVYGCNQNTWPTDDIFFKKVLPRVEEQITKKEVQWTALARLLVSPYYWDKKVNLLAKVMEHKWCVHGSIQDISKQPLWTINTTAFETGKDFRISRKRMGEKGSSFVVAPNFRLSHAMAASAGFPVLIGPYKLKTKDFNWSDRTGTISVRPRNAVLHLWDGGVYDNMGLDPLFNLNGEDRLTKGINYLIVSNASGNIENKTRRASFSFSNLKRLLDINMDQVESIKSRSVIDYFKKYHNGLYLKIGTQVKDIVPHCDRSFQEKEEWIQRSMKEHEVNYVKDYKTTLERMSARDFHKILQHGYETTTTMLACFSDIT